MAERRRKDRRGKPERIIADLICGILAVTAFGSSLWHVQKIAATNGQPGPISWAIAISVELVALVAILEMSRARAKGNPVPPAAVLALAAGVAMSAAANASTRSGAGTWPLVMALWPVIAYALVVLIVETRPGRSLEALAERVTTERPTPQPEPTPAPTPVPAKAEPRVDGRPSRDEVIAQVAQLMRDPQWAPDYPAMQERTGYGRSWCEKVVKDARAQSPARLEAVR